jgi:hypothetical protein
MCLAGVGENRAHDADEPPVGRRREEADYQYQH